MSSTPRAAIVTGSSSGIGLGIALAMSESGFRVVITGREAKACDSTAKAIVDNGGDAISLPGDVGDPENSQSVIEHTMETFGAIDHMINLFLD